MSRPYAFDELLAILGKPAETGPWLGGFPLTPITKLVQEPPRAGRYVMWHCVSSDRNGACIAISPPHDEAAIEEWYAVQACPQHDGQLAVTQYEGLSGEAASAAQNGEPRMLIAITHQDFENGGGAEWNKITAALKQGWIVSLVTDDARFPNYYFIIMERPGVPAHAHDIRGVPRGRAAH